MPEQSPITDRFGRCVKLLRKDRGLSQERLAAICNLDRTYISSIERGLRNVSLRNIEILATALDVTIAELFQCIEGIQK
jgi:transcriptional regulator with XRE-family HTH domain